jgi:hypothetical protein
MLDFRTAQIVAKAINKHFNTPDAVSLESVCRMQPISQDTSGSGYTILGLQSGDLTILVWVQFSEKLGPVVRNVKTQAW